jgi:integrase/recombinase XerC
LALLLACLGGLRRAEIAGLHAYDVDRTSGVIVVRGKGGHQRRVPLHPVLSEELAAEHARRLNGRHGSGFSGPHIAADGYLFPSPNRPGPITPQHLGKLLASVLPDDWTAHALRHRFATQAYAAERDIRAVQLLLGHSKPETTARYAATPEHAMSHAVNSIRL